MWKKCERLLDRSLSSSVFTWRQVLDLMVPGILDSLSIMFINALITALISKNGEVSVAAVALVGPITYLISCVFNGIGAGGTVIVAQCLGKDDPKLIRTSIGMTLWMTVLSGCIVCMPLLLFPEFVLNLIYPHADPAVMEKACMYLSGSSWSILFFTVYIAAFNVLRGQGESRKCLILSVIINVAYLLFSILFLNVLDMDIFGSAMALIVARAIGAACALAYLFLINPKVRMRFIEIFSFEKTLFKANFQVSIPLGLEQICISLGSIVSQMYMIPLGTTAIATNSIAFSMMGVLYSPAMSISNLSVTVVGRCIGAGKQDEAYTYGKRFNVLAMLLIAAAALIFYPMMDILLTQYQTTAEISQMTKMLLICSLPSLLLFWPMSMTLPSTLRAASDSLYPTIVSLTVLWTVSIGIGYILAIHVGLGLWGVWIANWSSWLTRSVAFLIRFRSKKWLTKSKLVESPAN